MKIISKIKIFFVFLLINSTAFSYDYQLSVGAIFQNEAPYLKEWIEFHGLMGVQHFWLYNNDSTDDYLTVLAPYIKKGIVTLVNWPSEPNEGYLSCKMAAYNDCISQCRNQTKWLACIDTDEFIVPALNKPITHLIAGFESLPNVGGIRLHSQFFGTSGLWEIPSDKTLVESLLMKAVWNSPRSQQCKTICRPDRVQKYWISDAAYYHPYVSVTMNQQPGQQPVQIDQLRIQHYWTRNEKYFFGQKIPRLEKMENRDYTVEEIHQLIDEMDRHYDPCILRFVPMLRSRLGLPRG